MNALRVSTVEQEEGRHLVEGAECLAMLCSSSIV